MSAALARPPVMAVVQQHAEEAAVLRQVRAVLVRSPHVQLHRLQRLDERIAAHLDGLAVAGTAGMQVLEAALESPTPGVVFALSVCALQSRDAPWLTRLAALAAALPEAERGFLSALGWVTSEDLQGTVRALLGSHEPIHRAWGLTACAMHKVDPGPALTSAIASPDLRLRASAWRVAGQMGRRDLADAARQVLTRQPASPPADDQAVMAAQDADQGMAAWALTLWGMGANDRVRQTLIKPLPEQALPCEAAQRLAIMAAPIDWGRDQVRELAPLAESSKPHLRRMIRMAGWVGDPQVVPWLIHHMADDAWARLAGEAFSMITGADLALLDLERKPPEGAEPGPNDKPEDADVAMDEDDSLPWPDQARVQTWWQAQASRFVVGQRYFAGEPPGTAHAVHVLKTAGQRQRIVAAEYLCLLNPGSVQFPVAAPSWRQSRWLATMQEA
jgi:uncharacterized protein (TIGR02270 family)